MATRKNGKPGSIFYDKSKDKWRGKISDGVQDDGTFKYKSVYGKSKAEVERKLAEYEKERAKRQGLIDSDETLNDYIIRDNDLDFRKRLIKESTYARRVSNQKAFSKFSISNIPIQNINRQHIETFFSEITVYSNSVIQKMWQMVNKAFDKAVWDNVIARNPLDPAGGIKMPKSQRADKEVSALTLEEEKQVIAVLSKELKAYNPKEMPYKNCYAPQLLLELYTGMRSGEINALPLSDIDLENRKIDVRYTVARGKDYRSYIGPTKTKAGSRTIWLDDNAYMVLRYYLEHIYKKKKERLLVETSNGEKRCLLFSAYNSSAKQYDYVTSNQCNEAFKRLCKKLGIQDGKVNAHML